MAPIAPPIGGRTWLNTEPIPWEDLRGRPVVVLFWSFGCEASLLMMRRLAERQAVWGDRVVTLAVHTPRFAYENDGGRVRAAVARHRIDGPVVHDPDHLSWSRYSPGGWPACAVVDGGGRVLGIHAGTGGLDLIDDAIAMALSGDTVDPGASPDRRSTAAPISARADDPPRPATSTLCAPQAVAVTHSGALVVADTGNDRMLVGAIDPDLRTFRPTVEITDLPEPVAVAAADESVVLVAERGSGDVVSIDLARGRLDVVADDLIAPTALLIDSDGSAVVADAGLDQLIRIEAAAWGDADQPHRTGPIAGSGFTGRRDGPAHRAELAQPVALTRAEAGIVFCDAASSNVRLLSDSGRVDTVTDNEFFEWGLVDGPAHRASLQRPSGLAALPDGSIAIADTGNDRIRLLRDRRITTLGLRGLDQPTGLCALGSGHLVVADTGNDRLVVVDPASHTAWPLAVYPAATTSVWETEPIL